MQQTGKAIQPAGQLHQHTHQVKNVTFLQVKNVTFLQVKNVTFLQVKNVTFLQC
jgi:hypothetical protein